MYTAAGASEMPPAFRAEGLQSALSTVVPPALLLTAVFLLIAAKAFGADHDRVAATGQTVLPAPA
jgi:hypothetical protein